jgi:uncharacterized RmlC-like cupin family protein
MKDLTVGLTLSLLGFISLPAGAEDVNAPPAAITPAEQKVMVIKTPPEIFTRQKLPNFVGISGNTVGARGLSMNLVIIPPGASAEPHLHKDFESAVYVLKGRVETRYGPGLKESVITEAGDFLFIPPNIPHQPINLSPTEAVQAIVVRNTPNEQEHVILYDPSRRSHPVENRHRPGK